MQLRPFATTRGFAFAASAVLALATASCGNGVGNEESARRAYIGIDQAVDKALNLGMQGFAMASSANIDPQTGMGDVTGTLVVGGQVDQGASANKQLRLNTTFTNYQDTVHTADDAGLIEIVYDADPAGATTLNLSLRGIPDAGDTTSTGTYTGTFVQTLHMHGDLEGDVTLNLNLAGSFQRTATGFTRSSSTIMGTATSSYGTYTVSISR